MFGTLDFKIKEGQLLISVFRSFYRKQDTHFHITISLIQWFSCRHTEAVAVGKLGRDLDGDLVLVPGQPRHVPEAAAQVGRPAAPEAAPHTGAARAAQPLVTAVQVTCGYWGKLTKLSKGV